MALKRVSEMSDEELLMLSQDKIDDLIKLEMAYEGVVEPVSPKEPDYILIPGPDVEAWEVATLNGTIFESHEDARSVADKLSNSKRFIKDYNYAGDVKVDFISDSRTDAPVIKPIKLYSRKLFTEIFELAKQNSKLKNNYNDLMKDFEIQLEKCNKIANKVEAIVDGAIIRKSNRELAIARFDEYLTLAQENVDIALSFIQKAYTGKFTDLQWDAVTERAEVVRDLQNRAVPKN